MNADQNSNAAEESFGTHSKEKLFAMADVMLHEGKMPSCQSVTLRLRATNGVGGSHRTNHPWLEEWKAIRKIGKNVHPVVELPPDLSAYLNKFHLEFYRMVLGVTEQALARQRHSLDADRLSFDRDLQEALDHMEAVERSNQSLFSKLKGSEEDVRRAYEEIARGTAPVRALESERATLLIENTRLLSQLGVSQQAVESLRRDIENLQAKLTASSDSLLLVKTEKDQEFRAHASGYALEIEQHRAAKAMDEDTIAELKRAESKSREEITALRERLRTSEEAVGTLNQRVHDSEIQIAKAQMEAEVLRRFIPKADSPPME
ncbi:MAG: DNA-binding protein [Burkholderiaceae bacterium]